MIKLFKVVRQKLLSENKFSKYMIYAFGEIILVVIGILIALQINNWNEIRKTKEVEKEILYVLLEDLNSAKSYSAQYIENEQSYLDIIEKILHNDSIKTVLNNNNTIEYFNKAFWDFEIKIPVINTYSDLKNAGKIAIIQNDSIRDRLSILEANVYNSMVRK